MILIQSSLKILLQSRFLPDFCSFNWLLQFKTQGFSNNFFFQIGVEWGDRGKGLSILAQEAEMNRIDKAFLSLGSA